MAIVTSTEKIAFLRSVFGPVYVGRDGKNVAVKCPVCLAQDASRASSTKKKLIIRLDDDAAHCWVCGWSSKSLSGLVLKYGGREAFNEYKERFKPSAQAPLDMGSTEVHHVSLPKDFKLVVLASKKDPDANAVRRYLESRRVEDRDIWFYRIGVSDEPRWRRRPIIPSFTSSGQLNYFVARSLRKNAVPKYDNVDVPKSDVVFNELNISWDKPLVVCEGPFDMFKCGDNSTCLLGAELNEGHALFDRIIENSTPVLLALDDDMKEKSQRVARRLAGYDVDVKVVDLAGHHDPGSMSKREFAQCRDSASQWTWDVSFKDRVRSIAARL